MSTLEKEAKIEGQKRLQAMKSWDKSSTVNGPPAKFFRETLRNDTNYITAWTGAGFTNQFMGYTNLIYLAAITDRVPIIPPFAPNPHINVSAGVLPFGDIFDLEQLSMHLRRPVLEWRDVKDLPKPRDSNPFPYVVNSPSYSPEPIGCWSTRSLLDRGAARSSHVIAHIGLDASYTRVHNNTRLKPDDPHEPHVVFSHLAALIYRHSSSTSSDFASPPFPDPGLHPHRYEFIESGLEADHHTRMPDSHLACFDSLYFSTSSIAPMEWRFKFSPAWRDVGQWLKFSKKATAILDEYMDALFPAGPEDDVDEYPPFIAVHVRRGDFDWDCRSDHCLPPLSVYQREVDNIKQELSEKRGIDVKDVVLMSDESAKEFWDEATAFGWLSINHEETQTSEKFGEWYPAIIDVAIQSRAIGFVGTEHSTLSLVSQRRVETWNAGIVRTVDPRSRPR
ncbi:hypothetical protein CPB83DRAFT_892162 [Crepidotus variabilis]|uniref:Uncharacterized protein n=1 Tax=Crepidotus variabilis TaxID=179855 RepID=A0A9P6JSL3_9AGAR|nr:hypothetical protein CPB83DRAFT_892162 [Crepidotus variabilis]